MSKYRLGVCPECKVRERDDSRKRLYQCEYCERWFCKRHVAPRMAFIVDFRARIKPRTWEDRAWEAFIAEEEAKIRNSHPDFGYTKARWDEIKLEKLEEWRGIVAFIEGTYTKPEDYGLLKQIKPEKYQPIEEREIIEGYCPKCGSNQIQTTAYRQQGTYYECLNCGHKLLVKLEKPAKLTVKPEKPTIEEKALMGDYCPKCGSERIQTSAYKPEGTYYKCLECGHKLLIEKKKLPETKMVYIIVPIIIAICVIVMLVLILSNAIPQFGV